MLRCMSKNGSVITGDLAARGQIQGAGYVVAFE